MAAAVTMVAASLATAIPEGTASSSTTLVVQDEQMRRSVAQLDEGEQMEIVYIHSIYREPARELFRADGAGLTMTAVVSRSEAVLDYYAVEGARSVANTGWLTLELADPVHFESLPLIATPVGERTVVVRKQCFPLYTAQSGRHLSISLSRRRPRSRFANGRCPFASANGEST